MVQSGRMAVLWAIVATFGVQLVRAEINGTFQGMMFLYRYGYISEQDMTSLHGTEDSEAGEMMKDALEQYQERNGLNITGRLDPETLREMRLPRCGIKDIDPLAKPDKVHRRKRYVLGRTRWRNPSLTYRYIRLQSGNQGRPEFQSEMDRAFRAWSAVSTLQFRSVTSRQAQVDINVQFSRGDHGDHNSFDGPASRNGPTLAHAFYPNPGIGGDVHFDDEENWVTNTSTGVDFYTVALHELGHSIGLDHSTVREAIMFPTYRGYRRNVALHTDDIAGVQQIYGPPSGSSRPVTPRRPAVRRLADPNAPDLCKTDHVDSAVRIHQSEEIYIFIGSYCYLLEKGITTAVSEGYPRLITQEFQGMENVNEINAALSWPDGSLFLFVGSRVWAFRNKTLVNGYPLQITQKFSGIPDDLSAACLWTRDQRTYFFKGSKFWRYDNTTTNPVKAFYPHDVSRWRGVSGPVDAVLDLGEDTYMFQGSSHYKYSNRAFHVLSGYPRKTQDDLFGCRSGTSTFESEEESELIPNAESSCENGKDGDGQTSSDSSIQSRRKRPQTSDAMSTSGAAFTVLVCFLLNRM